jgi:hypothetical protein
MNLIKYRDIIPHLTWFVEREGTSRLLMLEVATLCLTLNSCSGILMGIEGHV